MADFGLIAIPTHYTIQPVELGRWAEANGFESLWFGEHSHIPTSRKTPFPMGGELPQYYKEFFDPFIGLSAVAGVTEKLKIGTSVCLVPEHNTMNLAKMVACLDRVSNGRFLFGIGAGWNAEEMADHGVELKDRWKVTRDRSPRDEGNLDQGCSRVSRQIREFRSNLVLAQAGADRWSASPDGCLVEICS